MKKKKHAEDQLDLDGHVGTSAFPDSPSGGGTIRGTGLTTQGNRDRGRSGHFPIPRFDSIRGRFDSGIFASNNPAAQSNNNNGGGGGGLVQAGVHVGAGGGAAAAGDLGKITTERAKVSTTAQSTPSGLNGTDSGGEGSGGKAYNAPRSTVLADRLVAQGYTTSDVGRPVSGTSGGGASRGGSGGGQTDWGLAMSGEYPDLEGTDPYAIDNAMAETGTASLRRREGEP